MFAMLTAAGFLSFLQYLKTGKIKYYRRIWIISLLLFLTRPDGIIFAAVMGCYFLLWQKGLFRRERLLPFLTFFLLPFLAYNIWRISYFGNWLPNTFYAKATGAALNQIKKGGLYLFDFSLAYLLPLVPLVLYLIVRRKRTAADESHFKIVSSCFWERSRYTSSLWAGDYMAMYRFFVPLLPLLYLLITGEFVRTAGSGKNAFGLAAAGCGCVDHFPPINPTRPPDLGRKPPVSLRLL